MEGDGGLAAVLEGGPAEEPDFGVAGMHEREDYHDCGAAGRVTGICRIEQVSVASFAEIEGQQGIVRELGEGAQGGFDEELIAGGYLARCAVDWSASNVRRILTSSPKPRFTMGAATTPPQYDSLGAVENRATSRHPGAKAAVRTAKRANPFRCKGRWASVFPLSGRIVGDELFGKRT